MLSSNKNSAKSLENLNENISDFDKSLAREAEGLVIITSVFFLILVVFVLLAGNLNYGKIGL